MNKNKIHRIHPNILRSSRELRHPLTDAEKKVWERVRNNQLGLKIRRQHPIGRCITDFCCPQAKLIIEIDGDSHFEPEQAEYDVERTAWLEACGYTIIRFQNWEVHQDPALVVEKINSAIVQSMEVRNQDASSGKPPFPPRPSPH